MKHQDPIGTWRYIAIGANGVPRLQFQLRFQRDDRRLLKRVYFVIVVVSGCLCLSPTESYAFQSGPFPDFDEDGVVGFADFLQFAGRFGTEQGDDSYEVRFDLDLNGEVGFSDFLIFAAHFGKPAPRVSTMCCFIRVDVVSVTGAPSFIESSRNEETSFSRAGCMRCVSGSSSATTAYIGVKVTDALVK